MSRPRRGVRRLGRPLPSARAARRAATALAIGLVALAGLAACGTAALEEESYPGAPRGMELGPDALAGSEPLATWLDDGARLGIVTWGSSSCLPSVTSISVGGDNSLTVTLRDEHAGACTEDFGPRTLVIEVPPLIDPAEDLHLTLRPIGTPVLVPAL